jgi:hypothetical protein
VSQIVTALVGECDTITTQFAHVPVLREAIQQRDGLQRELDAAEESKDYQLAIVLGEKFDALQEAIKMIPLPEEDYHAWPARHTALVQKVANECKALFKNRNRAALEPLAAKLEQLKTLDAAEVTPIGSQDLPASLVHDAVVRTADGGPLPVYASNGVPITGVEELRSAQPDRIVASVRLMLRGEFRTQDGAGATHEYPCLVKCSTYVGVAEPTVANIMRLRREHAIYLEAQRLGKLVNTGCVRCYSIDPAGLYMVLENHGADLRDHLNPGLRSPQLVLEGIIPAVQALHALDIMHGDIKPENILVQDTRNGHYIVKLCDLECATKVGQLCEAATLGTKHYLAPEVRAAASVNGTLRASTAVDMFALGLVLWQVIKRNRTAALDCGSEARMTELYSDQAQLNAHLEYPELYRPFIERVTSLDLGRRPNVADLWRPVRALSMSNAHQGLMQERQVNDHLKHAIDDKLSSIHSKLDNVLDLLKASFDAVGGTVVEIAESLHQQVLLDGEQAQILVTIQRATADTLRRLTTAVQDGADLTPATYALTIQESMADMQARVELSISTALAAHDGKTTVSVQHLQSSLSELRTQFALRFDEVTAGLEEYVQEQRRSNADASTQRVALGRTAASLASCIKTVSVNVTTIQDELVRLRCGQESLGAWVRTELSRSTALNNMVQTLITGTHTIPTLAIVLPVVSKSWVGLIKSPMRLLRNQFRLFFLCSHTKQIAPCGPKGKGYKIQVTKQWVQDAAPVLRVGLVLVKVALLASGLPLPVPDLCSALADATKHSKYLDAALHVIKHPAEDDLKSAEHVMQTALEAVEELDVNNLLTEHGVTDQDNKLQLQEGSRKAYETIKEVLVAQGHNIALTCGLRQITCSRTGRTAWVLDNDATERAWKDSCV